jgi:hypothetical protein
MRKEEKLKQQEQIKAEKERLKREAMAEKARECSWQQVECVPLLTALAT